MLLGLLDLQMETILLPAGEMVTVRSAARLGGQGRSQERSQQKMPVGWGIHLSRMHGNVRKASFAMRVSKLVDVPKASLRD